MVPASSSELLSDDESCTPRKRQQPESWEKGLALRVESVGCASEFCGGAAACHVSFLPDEKA
eukprot:1917089-Rhodomonas_salina.1